jgi:hypothetical protein
MGKTSKDSVLRSVRLPAEMDERLVEAAVKEDRPVSSVIRRALEAALVPRPARGPQLPDGPLVRRLVEEGVMEPPTKAEQRSAAEAVSEVVLKDEVARKVAASPKPMRQSVQRDANAEYARMMAERQARLQKGSSSRGRG